MTPCDAELERVMGIEPTSKAWEALVLPLNYTRKKKRPVAARSRLSNIRAVLLIEAQIIRLNRFGAIPAVIRNHYSTRLMTARFDSMAPPFIMVLLTTTEPLSTSERL